MLSRLDSRDFMINPLKTLEINRFKLRHPRISSDLEGALVAQVTDVHMGRWVKAQHMRQVVSYVNAQKPDVVALTGDYVGYSKLDLDPCVAEFRAFDSPAFAVLGNHDHWTSTELARQAFQKYEVPLLTNENLVLNLRGVDISLVGVDDLVTKHADVPKAFDGVDPEQFCLTLNHVPAASWDCADHGAHLILSGHTHGFQFNIPRLTNALAERMGTKLFAGPYILENAVLYISRGLGSASWPWRIRAKPELTFFELSYGPHPELELISSANESVVR
ncbi:hypothetical protein FRD01_08080 [Microvenator marinus]|uniref:Calcineurin-like phosphoesterase domain-containing protein n=2 Tax=Microvenator marinus TaxID=2600177 RepID=A0A5B8XNI3_9DELT|nr:hypothetical protein FRD01_08080 [Microvenator marinus]